MVSIILPLRDGDINLIKRAVESVLAQTYSDFELIIVDDGSTKEMAGKLDELAEIDGRIRVIHIEPSGVSAARNLAIRESKGDIVTFIDGDDTISPSCFEEAVELLKDERIDVLFGGTLYVETADDDCAKTCISEEINCGISGCREIKALRVTEKRLHKTRAEVIGEPFRFENGGYINRGIAARFIRRNVFDDERFLFPVGIKMYEDAIWNLRMIDSLRVAYVKRIWYYYYENPASASNKYNPNVIDDMERPLEIMQGILDLRNPVEYSAYTRLLMDSLRYVYMCMYGNKRWKSEFDKNATMTTNKKSFGSEKRSVRKHLYHDAPWKEIGSGRFRKYSSKRDRQKALLYKMRLLTIYWRVSFGR